jgi:hypothetical protein
VVRAMQASAASALTMVVRSGHPHLILICLTPLLRLTLMIMKVNRAENKMKMMSEASRRSPQYLFGA